MPKCDILLAAYNGGKFTSALLDSLLAQTYQDFRLLVRDDGSTDDTVRVLQEYHPKFQGRMQFIEQGTPTGSARGNFSILMENSDADHVLCADIDDVWFPHKVEETLALLKKTESEFSATDPIFVFTDVIPVDTDLRPLSESYWKLKKIDPAISRNLSRTLVCAPMLGCASGMNRALVAKLTPVPEGVTGHDWWALLIAAALGKVSYSSSRTMMYRLHGGNSSAQKRVNIWDYFRSQNKIAFVRHGMKRRREQAQAVLERFSGQLTVENERTLKNFVATGSQDFLRRRLSLLKGKYTYPDAPRNIAMFLGV